MPTTQPAAQSRRWLMLAVLLLTRTSFAFQYQSVTALGPFMIERYGIEYTGPGSLMGLFMLPGIVLALPGGLLGQRFGEKRVALSGLALMIVGGLGIAVTDSYAAALLARIVAGTGAVLLNIVLTKMLMDWFVGHEIAAAMALFVGTWPLGIGLALVLLPSLAQAASTPMALAATVLLSAAAFLAVLVAYKPPSEGSSTPPTLAFRLSRPEWLLSISSGFVWAFFNIGLILLLAFGPSLLIASGTPIGSAGTIVSIVTWTVAVSVPLGGLFAQRVDAPNAIMGGALLALAVLSALFAWQISPLLVGLAFGIAAGPPAGLIMSLPSQGLRPGNRSAGLGVVYTCYYALMAACVPLAGLLRDLTADSSAPLLSAGGAMLLAWVSLGVFRLIQIVTFSQTPAT